ncbi:sensor histidine kinase [Saccharicrinis sp. FJH54]|uniref:sensor histidine kinase n=1 Tax=Saccharicrinis sp. FJH54 TaxID=3344665 RepID=UPI0035D423B0
MAGSLERKPRIMNGIDLKDIRIGLLSALFIYGLFGILDPFMMPINYKSAWFIRYVIILPAIVLVWIYTYHKSFTHRTNEKLLVLLLAGQIGIISMIAASEPGENAFWGYYAGSILVFLWAGFVFKFSFIYSTIVFFVVVFSYDAIAVFDQHLLSHGMHSEEFTWFLGNNFFLISSGVLAVIGSNRLQQSNKKIEEENIKYKLAKEKAEESDRLKSAFLANMSHEIRTPLNAILGFSHLLKDEEADEEEVKQFLGLINNSGNNLLRIINDIIDISKIEAGQLSVTKSRFNINEVLRNVAQKYQNLDIYNTNGDVEFIVNTPVKNDDLQIRSDIQRLEQVLDNLINNAFKFTRNGRIEVGYKVRSKEGYGYLEFFVKDTGKGIPTDKQHIIFERFRQVEEDIYHEGAGLGLSICKGILKLLEGDIWFESEENKGTTFCFTLPL